MAGLTLDSGALIAAERRSRHFWTIWKEAVLRDVEVTIPSGVIAQVWRGNNAIVARLSKACVIEVFDEPFARKVGELLAASKTSDVIDATVVLGAAQRHDAIVTSDSDDLEHLATCLCANLDVLAV